MPAAQMSRAVSRQGPEQKLGSMLRAQRCPGAVGRTPAGLLEAGARIWGTLWLLGQESRETGAETPEDPETVAQAGSNGAGRGPCGGQRENAAGLGTFRAVIGFAVDRPWGLVGEAQRQGPPESEFTDWGVGR